MIVSFFVLLLRAPAFFCLFARLLACTYPLLVCRVCVLFCVDNNNVGLVRHVGILDYLNVRALIFGFCSAVWFINPFYLEIVLAL